MCDDEFEDETPEPGVWYDEIGQRIPERVYWKDHWGRQGNRDDDDYEHDDTTHSADSHAGKRPDANLAPPIGKPMPKKQVPTAPEKSEARRREIVTWLSSSRLAEKVQGVDGFCVRRGIRVRLKMDKICEIVEWLDEEGIRPGKIIDGYEILAKPEHPLFGDVLAFYRIVIPAPFDRRESESWEDDVPF